MFAGRSTSGQRRFVGLGQDLHEDGDNDVLQGFTSYFLTFPGGGRLELMHRPDIQRTPDSQSSREFIGYAHLGVELGSRAAVDALTKRLQGDGFSLLDGPRRMGDGYYESIVADPEGNRIVITE
jgi:lactoylglutathione lyase